jgi:proline racemase
MDIKKVITAVEVHTEGNPKRVGLESKPENANDFIALGTKIWRAVNEQIEIQNPDEPEID